MPSRPEAVPALLFLHALPLDGSMWADQRAIAPAASYAPTLYHFGDTIESWASAALSEVREERIIVIGCSVGGSCALEVAALAPDRVSALVLIGTRAHCRPDPARKIEALERFVSLDLVDAWDALWAPHFSPATPRRIVDAVGQMMARSSLADIARGINVFHSRPSREDVLSNFAGDVAVVTGADDTLPGIDTSAAQAQMAKRGTLHVVADCGHYVPLEQPARLNAILADMIRSQR
jgi:pimeloyl-ACP methyl ester carboxylesterase